MQSDFQAVYNYCIQLRKSNTNSIYNIDYTTKTKKEKKRMKKREIQEDCAFYTERRTNRKNKEYIYPKCKITKTGSCICEYKKCTLYVEKEQYRKNCIKYPIMKYYGDYHGKV